VPRTCTVCRHPSVFAIQKAMLDGVPFRRIATIYDVGEEAVRRCRREHLSEWLAKAHDAQVVANSDKLITRLQRCRVRIEAAIDAVEENEDYALFFKGMTTLKPYLELIGEINQELERRAQVNLVISPVAIEILAESLEAYPEAQKVVSKRLLELSEGDSDTSRN
jgi:hypothetical protein